MTRYLQHECSCTSQPPDHEPNRPLLFVTTRAVLLCHSNEEWVSHLFPQEPQSPRAELTCKLHALTTVLTVIGCVPKKSLCSCLHTGDKGCQSWQRATQDAKLHSKFRYMTNVVCWNKCAPSNIWDILKPKSHPSCICTSIFNQAHF